MVFMFSSYINGHLSLRNGQKLCARLRDTHVLFGSEGGHVIVDGVVAEHPEGVAQVLVLDLAVAGHVEEEKRLREDG